MVQDKFYVNVFNNKALKGLQQPQGKISSLKITRDKQNKKGLNF